MSVPQIGFVSLGCPKASADSERILTQLRAEGYAIAQGYASADLVVVNTCGFIDSAIDESLDAIAEALHKNGKVIVTGCLGAKGDIVRQTHPQVLAVTGPHALDEVMQAVHQHLPRPHEPFIDLVPAQGVRLTPRHYAYLKISEGCNHRCSFCIIPSLRGNLISRPIGEVLDEAETLVNAGVMELLVISQDTSAYGVDLKYRAGFWQGRPIKTNSFNLASALGELGVWVRLHYVYPYPHVDALIPLMAEGLLLPYLDVPFQHAAPAILKAMKRPASSENTLQRLKLWREICPEIAVRSTFIVGFPGESEADFQTLLDFLEQAQLDRVGAFAYSAVAGASANQLANAVPETLKAERLERLMTLQAQISTQKLQAKIGTRQQVLVDTIEQDAAGNSIAIARSRFDAPEIDGVVRLDDGGELQAGDWVDVEIVGVAGHDLLGAPPRET